MSSFYRTIEQTAQFVYFFLYFLSEKNIIYCLSSVYMKILLMEYLIILKVKKKSFRVVFASSKIFF